MIKRVKSLLLPALCLALVLWGTVPVLAAPEYKVVEAYTADDHAYLFVGEVSTPPGSVSAQIAQEVCPVKGFGLVEEDDIPVETVFLIDVSTSIQPAERQSIRELLLSLIDVKPAEDAYAFVVFGEDVRALCDFTTDRWELSKALDDMVFEAQGSSIYDAVSQTVTSLDAKPRDYPVYRQLVVITDGVEQSEEGIIKEELYFQLASMPYPVHTIGCRYQHNSEWLKELFAISRISNAQAFSLDTQTDLEELSGLLAATAENVLWVELELPASLLDGATRQTALTVDTAGDGSVTVNYDLRLPLAHVDRDQSAQEVPEPAQEPLEAQESPAPAREAPPAESTPEPAAPAPAETAASGGFQLPFDLPSWWWIAAAGGVALLLTVIVVAVASRRKKKRRARERQAAMDPPLPDPVPDMGQTNLLDAEGHTQILLDGQQAGSRRLILIDLSQANRRFEIPLAGETVIGRDPKTCAAVIDYDKSVSREHCKLYERDGLVYVEDLRSSNKTYVNDEPVVAPRVLPDKSVLRLGKARFSVTLQNNG